ncbi:helix-turn-helix transcriptional regulator [Streptomyces globisporus]|uniref:Helix-turn-helix transcriptional regulator n=1 Tax=Streptomyces globisporus TaxID=1908 RepID=A0A927BN11_STRGL|nr:helix-turn-helix transcriptional regulator [Streptomyces globisporus]
MAPLGYELRQFREARQLSQQALARKALIDRSHLGRFERAERPVLGLRPSSLTGSWMPPARWFAAGTRRNASPHRTARP